MLQVYEHLRTYLAFRKCRSRINFVTRSRIPLHIGPPQDEEVDEYSVA